MKFDFIGDIHGHSSELINLLEKMDYRNSGGVYRHPERKVLFLGDFVDRGPDIRGVLNIVIPMVESGSALSVMGNHEFNYLSFHTPSKTGNDFLRPRSEKNTHQCQQTLSQLSDSENQKLLHWIWTLPLWIETDSFRAVHACWHQESIEILRSRSRDLKLTEDLLHACAKKGSLEYGALENVLKGIETPLPEELRFYDKDNVHRSEARVCWWDPTRKILLPTSKIDQVALEKFKSEFKQSAIEVSVPTFFGHYWEQGTPKLVNPKAVCLDYSVAKGNYLCAYRFDGEDKLSENKLFYVKAGA